jgi:glyoxylase-like metal-dependent hydrolase (beta-lactamase superfamily II)
MDGVAVSEEQITSIDSIAEGVRGLRIAFVNVFAVTHTDGSWSLIDAALPLSASHIRSWAEAHFATPPNALILTHGHFDHVSAAKNWRRVGISRFSLIPWNSHISREKRNIRNPMLEPAAE